jgi:hypothetical protein
VLAQLDPGGVDEADLDAVATEGQLFRLYASPPLSVYSG